MTKQEMINILLSVECKVTEAPKIITVVQELQKEGES